MSLVTADQYYQWAGASAGSLPVEVVERALAEAAVALAIEVDAPLADIEAHPAASLIAEGDTLRRASNLLAARNSPEGYLGAGAEGVIPVSAGHPLSNRAVRQIRAVLGIPEGVA